MFADPLCAVLHLDIVLPLSAKDPFSDIPAESLQLATCFPPTVDPKQRLGVTISTGCWLFLCHALGASKSITINQLR